MISRRQTSTNGNRAAWIGLFLALSTTLAACDDQPSTPLAPSATALTPTKPASAGAQKLTVEKATSKVDFMMEAPVEKIRGRAHGATEGELQIDPTDLTKTTGFLAVDISGIELYQRIQDEKTKEFGEEKKSEKQNEHARQWLEIGPTTPEDVRKKNSRVEFAIRSIESASASDVTKLTGAERKVTLKATGDFLMHGRKTQKTAEIEATFKYDGDKLKAVHAKTVKPFGIGLAEHEVKPRDSLGALAEKGLDVLAPKVAKEAMVSFEITTTPAGGAAPAATAASSAKP